MTKKKEDKNGDSKEDKELDLTKLDGLTTALNRRYGESTIVSANFLVKDPPRLPSGIFPIDYAIGGGFPIHATTCLWGPEHGAKTAIATKAVRTASMICWKCFHILEECSCSQQPLIMRSVWGDIEGTLDREWSDHLGAHPDQYHVVLADYGEQYLDVLDKVLTADDCGLVVGDSLAALVPDAEMDSSAEDQFMALQARMITRFVRKIKQRLIRERRRGHPCTVIFTNQMRTNLKIKFGDPETMAGGHGMFHEFSLILRCVKRSMDKKEADAKYVDASRSKDMASQHSISIRKEKVLTITGVAEFKIIKEDIPELELKKGMIDDYRTTLNYMKEYGLLSKQGNAWVLWDGMEADKQESIIQYWKKFPPQYLKAQMELVKVAKERLRNK